MNSSKSPSTEAIFSKAAKQVIQDQEECGIDIITDGEVRRENYIHYHCRHLEGVDFETLTEKVARTGNYKCWLPTITNQVKAKEEFLVKEWKNNQALTSTPIKVKRNNVAEVILPDLNLKKITLKGTDKIKKDFNAASDEVKDDANKIKDKTKLIIEKGKEKIN